MDLSKLDHGSVVLVNYVPYLFHSRKIYSGVEYLMAVDADANLKMITEGEINVFFTMEEMEGIVKSTEGEFEDKS